MATTRPRVQVTVDEELAEAMAAVPARNGGSRSKLIRDLALRGAQAEHEDREREQQAIDHFVAIADGEVDYDFDALREIHAERERSV